MITEIDRPDTDAADTTSSSPFGGVPSVKLLNMIALAAAVLWLLGAIGAVAGLADNDDGSKALWDYVLAAGEASGYLVVTLLAWIGAALVDAIKR